MCEYKSDYSTENQIHKTIVEEHGIIVDFNEVEAKLAETRFGFVAVFCRDVGITGSWEVVIADDDKKQLRKAKEKPAKLVFIIKSYSYFVRSKIKHPIIKGNVYQRSTLLARVFD